MEKDELMKMVLTVVVSAVLGGAFVAFYFLFPSPKNDTEQSIDPTIPGDGTLCPMDAKLCPDGSAVGRVGPNCEFAPCPGEGDGDNFPGGEIPGMPPLCVDQCGDGVCQEVVCEGSGCPCTESEAICPADCLSSAGNDVPTMECPKDARVCPDGSVVSRTGPNCEFAPCL